MYISNYQKQTGINFEFNAHNFNISVLPQKAKIIFYIITEALNNIKKHSLAKKVELDLDTQNNNHFMINIRDDGKGFDVDNALLDSANYGKLGLISMQQRTNSLNGSITINSALQKGTQVLINIPLSGIIMETHYEI